MRRRGSVGGSAVPSRRPQDRLRWSTAPVAAVLAAGLIASVLGAAAVLPANADNGRGGGNSDTAPLQAGGGGQLGPSHASGKPADTKKDGPSQAPLQAGGGFSGSGDPQAAVNPNADVEPAPGAATSDAAPSLDPGFVDAYAQTWKAVEADKRAIAKTTRKLASARRVASQSTTDLQVALRERGRADARLAGARTQFGLSVRNLYISGTTDVDVVLGVLGSEPDDVLANIDSFMYLRQNSTSKTDDYVMAQQTSLLTQSAAAQIAIRSADDQDRISQLLAELSSGRKRLAKDQRELQRLVSVAAPQTVVGKDGCPKDVLIGTVPDGVAVKKLCEFAVKHAPTPQAAIAIKYALISLGAPYACEGIGRLEPWRYDCSSYVSRAYSEGAGLRTAGTDWAPSTRNMVPWDGASLDPHYAVIPPSELKPGDLVLYDTCPAGQTCPYRHVVMYLGPMEKGGVPMMAHTNGCGLVAHVEAFTGTDVPNLLGVRRVMALSGEKIHPIFATPKKPGSKPGGKPAKKG